MKINSTNKLQYSLTYIFVLKFLLMSITTNAQISVVRITNGQPLNGNYYLGDKVNTGNSWFFNFEIGQNNWNSSQVGLGQNTDGVTGWNYADAIYYENGTGNNRRVRRNIAEFQFSNTGRWYIVGRARASETGAYTYADETDWTTNQTFSITHTSYWDVSSLGTPFAQIATSSTTSNVINLSWEKWEGRNVMIVRNTTNTFTSPSQGIAYTVGTSIGTGTVVYNGGATSFDDTNTSPGTQYFYAFYSENYSYYSGGVTSHVTTNGGWLGNNNSEWTNPTNWTNNTVPTSNIDVVVLASVSYPLTLNANAHAKSITINNSASLHLNTFKLTLSGNLTNNGTFDTGSGTVEFNSSATIGGSNAVNFNHLIINPSAVITLNTVPTVNGTFELKGGNIDRPLNYGPASTLKYSISYDRYYEWSEISGAGYPHNVEIAVGTLNLRNGNNNLKQISGDLTIASGATLDMAGITDGSDGNTQSTGLRILGNLNNNGNIIFSNANKKIECNNFINAGTTTLSDAFAGDLRVMGDFNNIGTFNCNTRAVFFEGAGTQNIYSTNTLRLDIWIINKSAGSVVMHTDVICEGGTGINIFELHPYNTLELNGNSFTLGKNNFYSTFFNGSVGNYGKIKGGGNSKIIIKGNGSTTSYLSFDQSNPGVSNSLHTFEIDRQSSGEVRLADNIFISNLLDIINGNLNGQNSNIELLPSATGRLSSTNTSAALTVNNLILGKSSTANAQFYRNGRPLTVGNKVKVKVSFDQTGKWHFIAFPFAISAVEKSDGTAAVLGTDYTLGQYNATKRAQRISGWESSTDNPMTALKGYIINRRNTGPDNKDLYFVTNEKGAHAAFAASNNLALSYTTHTGGLNVNFGWNFVAHPLVANGQSTLTEGEFHYGYDGTSDQYSVGFGASCERQSFDAYFIKTAAPGNLTVNLSAPQGAPRRTTVDGGSYQMALHHNNMQYQSHIRMHEAATFAYDELYDAPYSTPWNATTARFYSFAGNETMALNTVSGEGEILLGARFPSKGSYKISWAGNMPGYIAQLVDMSSGEITDMRYNNDYSFEANAGDINNRFKVVLSSDVSTNNKIYINNLLYVNARSNTLYIEGTVQGDRIKLYDSTGREIHQQTATNNAIAIGNLPKGIYIINIEQNEGIWRQKVVMQ